MAENAFRVLTIRSAGTTAQPALYPLLSQSSREVIAWEEQDGQEDGLTQRYFRARGVTVSRIIDGAERPILRLRRLRFDVWVTAGRLVLACDRYRTSNAWQVAGPGAGFGALGLPSARADRRQGSMMVGHIRYPWIRSISPLPRRRWYGRDALIIEFAALPRTPMLLRLDLMLPLRGGELEVQAEAASADLQPDGTPPAGQAKDGSAGSRTRWLAPRAIAREITMQAIAWRKSYDFAASQPELQALAELEADAQDGRVNPDPGRAGTYRFPTCFPVSAYPWFTRKRP
jgi:hypothetical protein